jgi:hypothetical protein
MSIARPTVQGGSIAVSDSDQLATLDISGLPVGTVVWNEDVGAPFKLTASDRTAITIDPADGYATGSWTFANATFTGFEDCTLLISLAPPNEAFGAAYNIDTVTSPTEVAVTPSPDGTTTAPLVGGVTLFSDALVTDQVVSANGTIGVRWVVVTTEIDPVAITASVSSEYDSITAQSIAGQDLSITGLDGDADGDYEFEGQLLLTGSASGNHVTMRPNGVATDQVSTFLYASGVGVASAVDTLLYMDFPTNTADSVMTVKGTMTSKTGRNRIYTCVGAGRLTDGSGHMTNIIGYWTDTATAITSLVVHSDIASGLKAGSYIRLRKLRNLT